LGAGNFPATRADLSGSKLSDSLTDAVQKAAGDLFPAIHLAPRVIEPGQPKKGF
jgi:hypothetical protein